MFANKNKSETLCWLLSRLLSRGGNRILRGVLILVLVSGGYAHSLEMPDVPDDSDEISGENDRSENDEWELLPDYDDNFDIGSLSEFLKHFTLEPKETDQQTRERVTVLNKIDELNLTLRTHYGASDELDVLAAIAGGVGAVILDGVVTTGVSRYLSGVMAERSTFIEQATAQSLYSAAAFSLALHIMQYLKIDGPIALSQHVEFAFKAVGMGQFLGFMTLALNHTIGRSILKFVPAALRTMTNRSSRFSNGSIVSRENYDRACHYIAGSVLGSFGYYLVRSVLTSTRLKGYLDGVKDNLAVNRTILKHLEKQRQAPLAESENP